MARGVLQLGAGLTPPAWRRGASYDVVKWRKDIVETSSTVERFAGVASLFRWSVSQ